MTAAEGALVVFTACNILRVLAYLPQIVRIARDRNGASAISTATWSLFAGSHLSTVVYAILTLSDWKLALVFAANTLACVAILGLTFAKRRQFARRQADERGEAGPGADLSGVPQRLLLKSLRS